MSQCAARLVKRFSERHLDQFKLGKQAFVFRRGQSVKKVVLFWGIRVMRRNIPTSFHLFKRPRNRWQRKTLCTSSFGRYVEILFYIHVHHCLIKKMGTLA